MACLTSVDMDDRVRNHRWDWGHSAGGMDGFGHVWVNDHDCGLGQ